MMIKIYAASLILLSMSSLSVAQDDEAQAVVDNLVKSINASVARNLEHSNKVAEKTSQNKDVSSEKSTVITTCTDADGKPQNVEVRGLMENTVIVNCQTNMDGDTHITIKGDGATREISTVRIQGGAKKAVIINDHQLGAGLEIVVEGKNAKASVGNVEVKGGRLNKSAIINSTTIDGGKIKAKGDGASVSIGTVTIGD